MSASSTSLSSPSSSSSSDNFPPHVSASSSTIPSLPSTVSLLDYGAGNVRSLRNAITHLGYTVIDITTADDIRNANAIIFPGVGSFGQAMGSLNERGWTEALREYLLADRPFFGICLGMQSLFEESEESPGTKGLGIIKGVVSKFNNTHPENGTPVKVPQIGWNGISSAKPSLTLSETKTGDAVYFVHSFKATPSDLNKDWVLAVTDYGGQRYISVVGRGNVVATQFHPEKSGRVGLTILRSFLKAVTEGRVGGKDGELELGGNKQGLVDFMTLPRTQPLVRVIACLDVRSNDQGDLVVTKGDQYDVREGGGTEGGDSNKGHVRNLGKPVALCRRYYEEGADEVVFLNITSFRQGVIEDIPMLQVLEQSSENVFVPLTVGGGVREYVDSEGRVYFSLEVASRYFRAGADKISIGSDAVFAAESLIAANGVPSGTSSIETISTHYGAQAVVVSIDPKRCYVSDPTSIPGAEVWTEDGSREGVALQVNVKKDRKTICKLREGEVGPNGETYCWWQATVKGGREVRDLCAIELARACQLLGAGEIMLNCIDMDGQNKGYDVPLISAVQKSVSVPVIASSGAGSPLHFSQVVKQAGVSAALAAGIFHRSEVRIQEVKDHLVTEGIPSRI